MYVFLKCLSHSSLPGHWLRGRALASLTSSTCLLISMIPYQLSIMAIRCAVVHLSSPPLDRCSLSLLLVHSLSLLLCPRFGRNSCICICQIEFRVPHPVLRSAIHISLSFSCIASFGLPFPLSKETVTINGHLSCGQSIGSSGSTMDWWLK